MAQSGDPRGVGEWGSGDGAEGGTELCRGVSSQKILRSRDQSSVDSEPASASLGILAFCFLALLNTADSVSLYSIIDFLRSIPSNSTLFLLRDTRFLTEPGMRTERRSETATSVGNAAFFGGLSPVAFSNRVHIKSEDGPGPTRNWEGDANTWMETRRQGGRKGEGGRRKVAGLLALPLRRNRAAARRRRRWRGMHCARPRTPTRETSPVCAAVGQCP